MNGSYRDSSTMHSSSYGYNYNGMDLSINRSASSSHFGAVGESSRGFPSPAQESRFRQASSCSLSSPDSLPCSNSESHGGKPAPSPSDQATSASTTNTNFTELDETSASSGADEGTPISSSIPRAQAEPIATSTAATEGQAPQIFPWMRKLHISHGTATSFSVVVVVVVYFSHIPPPFLFLSPVSFFFFFPLFSASTTFPFLSLDSWRESRRLLFLWLHTECNAGRLVDGFPSSQTQWWQGAICVGRAEGFLWTEMAGAMTVWELRASCLFILPLSTSKPS